MLPHVLLNIQGLPDLMLFEKELAVQIDIPLMKSSLLIKKAVNFISLNSLGNEKQNRLFPHLHFSCHPVLYTVVPLVNDMISSLDMYNSSVNFPTDLLKGECKI